MILALLVAAAFVAAVTRPLFVYTASLALFGLPHVLAELRFVHARFGAGTPRPAWVAAGALLAGVVVGRLGAFAGWWASSVAVELAFVVALCALALPRLARHGLGLAAAGAALIAAVAVGALYAPIPTILVFAVLHNLTPLGFLAEGVGGAHRGRALLAGGVVFVGLPLLIASGLPGQALAAWSSPEWTPLPSGPLGAQLGGFFPRAAHGEAWILGAFAAVAFAQLMHHGAVLTVLPRMVPGRWPWWLVLGLVGVAAVSTTGFMTDWATTKRAYGVFAAVHAWVELPILLAALAGPLAARWDAGAQARGR